MTIRSGKLVYGQRAFMQDADVAMGGDIMRGLVELITNADDAYRGKGGDIVLRVTRKVENFKALVSVHDKAGGLTGEAMKDCFTYLGNENQGSPKGIEFGARGLFGRGAKDVAGLGKAKFMSIRDGKYSELEIDPSTAGWTMERLDDDASSADYEICGLLPGESGLVAQIYLAEQFSMPANRKLMEKIETNVQLRALINRNKFAFVDEEGLESLLRGLEPIGEKVIDLELQAPTNYSQPVRLVVHKLPSKSSGPVSEYSKHGLVISGRGAAFENSFLLRNGHPEAGWFCGILDAPEIYDLSRSFNHADAKPENPIYVISRNRTGLVKDHPYYTALSAVVDEHLRNLFDEQARKEGAARREGANLKRRLQSMQQLLGPTLKQILDEDGRDDLPEISGTDVDISGIHFIPPRRVLYVDEEVSLTIRIPENLDCKSVVFDVIGESENFVIAAQPTTKAWHAHERLPFQTATVKIKAIQLGAGFVQARLGQSTALAAINVVTPETIVEAECAGLEITPENSSVSPTRAKNLLLRAPIEFVGERVNLVYEGVDCEGLSEAVLRPSPDGKASIAKVRVLAKTVVGAIQVHAKLGDSTVRATIHVRELAQGNLPNIEVQFVGSENPPRRVDLVPEDGKLVVRIFARHASLKNIFGTHTGEGFEKEETSEALATTSELVASQLASYLVEKHAAENPIRYQDASSFFVRYHELAGRIAFAAQSGLMA